MRPKKARRGATALSGILLLDKPLGWTSHDLVARLRGLTGEGRIGHAGTLDPDASGLMIMMIGQATKLSDDLIIDQKSYRATISFGTATTTDDAQGQITQQSPIPEKVFDPAYAQILLDSFLGKQQQVPPDFSALKQGGKTAHHEARKGRPLTFKPRDIEVFQAQLLQIDQGLTKNSQQDACAQQFTTPVWTVDFRVSKGSYIRALARDIGLAAGTHAHLSGLCRLSSGDFDLKDAVTVDEIVKTSQVDHLAVADYFVPRSALLQSLSKQRINAAGIAGRRVGPSVVTIGVFDGVHQGHQHLLSAVVDCARAQNVLATAITFDQHPTQVLRPHAAPQLLMSLEDRIAAIKSCGIDRVIVLPFNHKLSQQSATDFFEYTLPTLVQVLPNQEIIVGENFRLGKGADACPIKSYSGKLQILQLHVDRKGIPFSSTRIRKDIAESKK